VSVAFLDINRGEVHSTYLALLDDEATERAAPAANERPSPERDAPLLLDEPRRLEPSVGRDRSGKHVDRENVPGEGVSVRTNQGKGVQGEEQEGEERNGRETSALCVWNWCGRAGGEINGRIAGEVGEGDLGEVPRAVTRKRERQQEGSGSKAVS
jgi:hypothetical protein